MSHAEQPSSAPDWLALAGAALTAGLSLLLRMLGATAFFVAGAVLFWTAFVILHTWRDRRILRTWGFRTENLRPATLAALVLFLLATSSFALLALWKGTLHLPWNLLPQFFIYPVWGVIQQFLILAIFAGNLEHLALLRTRRVALILVTAAVFGAVHLYDPRLAAATFALELVVVPIYLRYRNLWPLGVLHGWLGALFYAWVLDRDLWSEIVTGALAVLHGGP
jgi:membrane protease YdiL (CAAX protease family)